MSSTKRFCPGFLVSGRLFGSPTATACGLVCLAFLDFVEWVIHSFYSVAMTVCLSDKLYRLSLVSVLKPSQAAVWGDRAGWRLATGRRVVLHEFMMAEDTGALRGKPTLTWAEHGGRPVEEQGKNRGRAGEQQRAGEPQVNSR